MLRLKNHSVFDVFTNYFLGGAQRAPKIDFGRVLGPFESPLGGPFGHVGGAVELLGHLFGQNGTRNVKMRAPKAILARVEVARGSQRHSMGRFWGDVPHLLCVVLYFGTFSCKKV